MKQWKNILKGQKKEALKYSYVDSEGIQYTTNEHILIAMNEDHHLDIEHISSGLAYPSVATLKGVIPNTDWGNLNILDINLINNPSKKINPDKRKSKNNPYVYTLKDSFGYSVTVNNDYLKLVLDILGEDSKCYAIGSTRPVLIESPKGKAIIMPVVKW